MHKEIDPVHQMGEVTRTMEAACPHCKKSFTVSTGCCWETYYNINGEVKYGNVYFCSITCMLHIVTVGGPH